jgi:hypothetical protein
MSGLTPRAPEPRKASGPWWWESARFQAVFLAQGRFRQNGVLLSRPPAGNANRSAADNIVMVSECKMLTVVR